MTATLSTPVLAPSRCACASEATWHLDGLLACDVCLAGVLRTAHREAPFAPPCPEPLPALVVPSVVERPIVPPAGVGADCRHCGREIRAVAWAPAEHGGSFLIYAHLDGRRDCGPGRVAQPWTYQPEEGTR